MADQITPLPTPPSTSDPANFDARADAFLAALPTFQEELNEFGSSLNSLSTTTSSVSSVAIGTGTKNFTVDTGKSLFVGMSYRMAYDANNWMNGEIISYDSGTGALSLDVDATRGSGTYAAWVGTLSFNGVIDTEQLAPSIFNSLTTVTLDPAADYVAIADGSDSGNKKKALLPPASESGNGIVELATDAEVQAGTDTDRAITPAGMKNALGFSDYYESSQQTITAGGSLTLAHELGRKPALVKHVLQCTTAEGGYSIGDELTDPYGDSGNRGVSIVPDATNLNIRYGSGASVFFIARKDTGASFSITPANWRLVVRAWG